MWDVLISPLYCQSSGWGKQSPAQWPDRAHTMEKNFRHPTVGCPGRPNQSFLFCFLWNKTSAYCFSKSIRSSAVISSSKSGAEDQILSQNWTGVKKGAVIMATVVSDSECQPAWTLLKTLGNNHFILAGHFTTERITTNTDGAASSL